MVFHITLISTLLFFCLGASSCGTTRVTPDTELSALKGGDSTGIVEGCGNQPIPGYTYCRKMEGDPANGKLWFHAPPAQCPGDESCVSLRIYRKGDDPIGMTFPRGITRVGLEWKELLIRDRFEVFDRGFWPYDFTIKSLDDDGRDQFTFVDGEIRLVVYSKNYIPLHDVKEDPNYVWVWEDGGCVYKMTTGGRTHIGCEGKE